MGYRYIGSKARIADNILQYIGPPKDENSRFIDAFSGTGIVASKAADLGWKVIINDMMHSASVMSEARLVARLDVPFTIHGGYEKVLEQLNQIECEGYIWREYSPASFQKNGIERKYFTEKNAKKIDGIVAKIHEWKRTGSINAPEFALLTSTLINAVNNVANIAGTYGCFLSKWQNQALETVHLTPLKIREQQVNYSVSTEDVFNVKSCPNDIVYLDPPYTKRQYASYYHILETITVGDEPEIAGVSGLRPWKSKASVFCYKVKALQALVDLVRSQQANRVLISYSNDGHIKLEQLVTELNKIGMINVVEIGTIGRYRPNIIASSHKAEVKEYLLDFSKNKDMKK